jgi:hypothetical protein
MPSSQSSKSNRSLSYTNANKSQVAESEIQRLQREVDNYTRKYEQEKRRLFGIEETYNLVYKEHHERQKKVQDLTAPGKNQDKKLLNQIKTWENQLELAVTKYNEVLAANKKLRGEVDVLRRERGTFLRVYKNMAGELDKADDVAREQAFKATVREKRSEEAQQQILDLKNKNESEQAFFIDQYDQLQRQMKEEKKKTTTFGNKKGTRDRTDHFDTQTILKRRLQRIILNNKEKVKVIEQYQKNMKVIDESFTVIKENSGITDIDEIMNTFIKSEEQNYSLFNYVNLLTQDIDFLEENNKELEQEIKELELEVAQKQKLAEQTPDDVIRKQKLQEILKSKEDYVEKERAKLNTVKKPLEEVLQQLHKTIFHSDKVANEAIFTDITINEQTVDQFLAVLEENISKLLAYKAKVTDEKNVYTAALILEEIPPAKEMEKMRQIMQAGLPQMKDVLYSEEKDQPMEKLLDEHTFIEMAYEQIDKAKDNFDKKKQALNNSANLAQAPAPKSDKVQKKVVI